MTRDMLISRLRFILIAAAAGAAMLWVGTGTAATVTVDVGDIFFCGPQYEGGVCEIQISAGDTVRWDFTGAELPHTTTECGASCDDPAIYPRWDSDIMNGGTFEHTFSEPGTYLYYCRVHPNLQRGRIVVTGGGGGRIGDVDCDGDIDAIDAALLLQHGAGLLMSLSCQQNADANGDGSVNAIDAALVLQYSAGYLTELPP